jgi:hypothetical protein
MDKFLKVIESNLPSTENDAKQEVINQLAKLFDNIKGITVTPIDHNSFRVKVNNNEVILNMDDVRPLTEGSFDPSYSIDKGVEGLAAKAIGGPLAGRMGTQFGTAPQKAKAALRKRQNISKKAIDVYDNVTKDLEKAITSYLGKTGSAAGTFGGTSITNPNII